MNRSSLDWQQLVSRVAVPPVADAPPPPPDLAGRVLAVWQTLRRDEQVRRWARWSLRGALVAAAIGALAVTFRQREEPPILLSPPSAPLLTPQFPAPPSD